MSVIDGAANALVRMDGSKDTAMFLYAAADRIVAGMREPTPMPPGMLPVEHAKVLIHEIEEVLEPDREEAADQARGNFIVGGTTIAAAVLIAFLIACAVSPWL
jgi:hypothetical protein